MTWAEITENWGNTLHRLQQRFPHIDRSALNAPPPDTSHLARHLAESHDLTVLEAAEELRDWMFVEGLARQAFDIRAS